MPISIPRLRTWFAILAVIVIAVVAGFYFYARLRMHRALKDLPEKLGVEIQQSTEGFSLSKSEGGRTLFTIRASKAVQYKENGRAELQGVDIIVYGRKGNRFDQIRGSDFEYDPQNGLISARGEVRIDLEGNEEGPLLPDQAIPKELQNPIHLKTSGLVFNQKTGIAHTGRLIQFSIAKASGSAMGATYDAHNNKLTLESDVNIQTEGSSPTVIHAAQGEMTKDPRELQLAGVHVEQTARTLDADRVVVSFNDDNEVSHVAAFGNVRLAGSGREAFAVRSPLADLDLAPKNRLRMAVFSGGVQFDDRGSNPITGTAERLTANFTQDNRLRSIYVTNNVRLTQNPSGKGRNQQTVEILADAVNAFVHRGNRLEFMETSGAARVMLTPAGAQHSGERTVITAGQFRAEFDAHNRMKLVRGEPDAVVVSTTPGEPDRTSMSRTLTIQFAPGGGITGIEQDGNFEYHEQQAAGAKQPGSRAAYAERAHYNPGDDLLTLTGSPRFVDGGTTITAQTLRVSRRTGDAFAEGDVKTTYSELRRQPNGALFATANPVHVTASAMSAQRKSGIARYTGGARIWQGANIVEAPTIEFDSVRRSMVAKGTATQPVSSVFVQVDKNGKTTPMVVTAAKLDYVDADRRARFSGGVLARGMDLAITADHVDVYLHPASAQNEQASGSPSQLERIVAKRHVVIQQAGRRATGEELVYTAADGKFVLTGGPPMVTDREHGTIRGDSLTFYSHDDRVVVKSNGTSRTVTRTTVH